MKIILVHLIVLITTLGQIHAQNELQKLIDDASDGSEIIFPSGEYIINSPLLIYHKQHIAINAEKDCKIFLTDSSQNVLMIRSSTGIALENLILSHYKPMNNHQYAETIRIWDSGDIILDNCELTGFGDGIIKAEFISDLEINHCYLYGDDSFILSTFAASDILIQNSIIDNKSLPKIFSSDRIDIRNSIIKSKLQDILIQNAIIENTTGMYNKDTIDVEKPGLRE